MNDARMYDPAQDVNAQANEARPIVESSAAAVAQAQAEAQAKVIVDAVSAGKRAFINPAGGNYSLMIRPGKVMACYAGTRVPVVPGQPAVGGVVMARVGDIHVQFTGGILIIDPADENAEYILTWADSHPDICRDCMDPQTETWAALKKAQQNTAMQEPSLPNIDIDAVLRGDFSGFSQFESATQKARRQLAAMSA